MDQREHDFSFTSLFLPFNTRKAIHFIIILGLIVYFNSLFGAFVWDDESYIRDNPKVHAINIVTLFQHNNSFNGAGYYRPLSATYFATIYSLFGSHPFYFHFLQICLHITNTILLFLLLKRCQQPTT